MAECEDILFCDRCMEIIGRAENANAIIVNGIKNIICNACLDSFADWLGEYGN